MNRIKYMRWLRVLYCIVIIVSLFWAITYKKEGVWETAADAQEKNIVAEKKKIAITFDDGPHEIYTPELLDGLKKRGVKATFFLIGKNIEKNDNHQIVRRMKEEGHLIGNHTYNHVEISKVDNSTALRELNHTSEIIYQITGERVEYMRPPFGVWQKSLEKEVCLIPVMWTVDPLDWTTANMYEIVNKVVTEIKENDIILLHDCYESSVRAALQIIDILTEEGYEFVTVEELILE
ncbi:MAG: polysaccharide deacetylase family protein [Schaedlerella sp.]|nr:polysaccharide deacetylase family protein [Schaedlerella sp.]